jgi:hypothetical protein
MLRARFLGFVFSAGEFYGKRVKEEDIETHSAFLEAPAENQERKESRCPAPWGWPVLTEIEMRRTCPPRAGVNRRQPIWGWSFSGWILGCGLQLQRSVATRGLSGWPPSRGLISAARRGRPLRLSFLNTATGAIRMGRHGGLPLHRNAFAWGLPRYVQVTQRV